MGVVDVHVKRAFRDLKSMVGYKTHNCIKTDPIDPNAWWQRPITPTLLSLPPAPPPTTAPLRSRGESSHLQL